MPRRDPVVRALVPRRAVDRLARFVGQPPVKPAARALTDLIGAAVRRWDKRPGARTRHLRRLSRQPLPELYRLYPEARKATPREIGLRSIGVDQIAGTGVGGPAQRGADFLPLPAFRSRNWAQRWQRLRRAMDQLVILPPIDVVRYADRYWVTDGHNRTAAALYGGQVEVDANVTELVPPGKNPSERPANLAAALAGTRSLRSAGRGTPLSTVSDDVILGVPGRDDGPSAEPATAEPAPSPTREVPAEPPAEPV